MDFGRAVGVAFSTGSNRKPKEGEVDETEQVTWGHALIGIAILVIAQLGLIFWPNGGRLEPQVIFDLCIVTFGALILPFILFWLGATFTRTMDRLPAAFLFLGVALAALEVIAGVLARFGTGQSGFIIGLRLAVMILAAKGF